MRRALLDRLKQSEDSSEAALLVEARRYMAAHPGKPETDVIAG